MLRVDPKMIGRLGELETDLLTRKARAEDEGWVGEIEGIDLTLRYLDDKRQQANRLNRRPLINLGTPALRTPTT